MFFNSYAKNNIALDSWTWVTFRFFFKKIFEMWNIWKKNRNNFCHSVICQLEIKLFSTIQFNLLSCHNYGETPTIFVTQMTSPEKYYTFQRNLLSGNFKGTQNSCFCVTLLFWRVFWNSHYDWLKTWSDRSYPLFSILFVWCQKLLWLFELHNEISQIKINKLEKERKLKKMKIFKTTISTKPFLRLKQTLYSYLFL